METNRQADSGRYEPSETYRWRQPDEDRQAQTDRPRQKSGDRQARKDRHGKTGIYGTGVNRETDREKGTYRHKK